MWKSLTEVPTGYAIGDDEVHVWLTRVQRSSRHIQALSSILAPEEWQKADRFHFQADAQRHVIGRVLVRLLLGRLLDFRPDTLRFRYNDFGKPYVSDAQNKRGLQFNISHSGDLILIALSAGREIGVDVELVRQNLEVDKIAVHSLSMREQADLVGLPPGQRHSAFFRCLTRKEAFIKARGEGLSLPLNQFDVSLRPADPAMLLATRPDTLESGRWVIRDLDVGRDYQAAVAVEGKGWHLDTMEWRPA